MSLKKAYDDFCSHDVSDEEEALYAAVESIGNLSPDSAEISDILESNKGDSFVGVFISACINKSSSDTVEITCDGQDYVCYRLDDKNVVISGNVGSYFCYEMLSGSVILKGSSGRRSGSRMQGGSITIEQNAGDLAGNKMEGGEIHIKGNAGDWAGSYMQGGLLKIDGSTGIEPADGKDGGEMIVGKENL